MLRIILSPLTWFAALVPFCLEQVGIWAFDTFGLGYLVGLGVLGACIILTLIYNLRNDDPGGGLPETRAGNESRATLALPGFMHLHTNRVIRRRART